MIKYICILIYFRHVFCYLSRKENEYTETKFEKEKIRELECNHTRTTRIFTENTKNLVKNNFFYVPFERNYLNLTLSNQVFKSKAV